MEYIQCAVTVNEGKWLIAHAVSRMPVVRQALERGRIVFKAGTTVSCISQLLLKYPLRISGRISARGTVSALNESAVPHTVLYDHGRFKNIDGHVDESLLELEPDDVLIIGANMIDVYGNAAMLAGSPAGNACGRAVSAMTGEGFHVIVAAGLEKLIPGTVRDSILQVRRKGIAHSQGMACGLFPVFGQIITELEAVRLLADVEVCLIGRGGIDGAEGGCVFQVRGMPEELEKLETVLGFCRNQVVGGDSGSLTECRYPCGNCGRHLSCRYKTAGKQGKDNNEPLSD